MELVRGRGQAAVLPKCVEVNLLKLVLACDERGDRNAGEHKVRRAVGQYIKGTSYEAEFRSKYPASWNESEQVVVPGQVWYDGFFKRMQALPEYADIVETKSGRATETRKLMYYNTENVNYWYDETVKVLCDELKIARRATAADGDAEIVWTGNRNRILFSDETAVKDRNESMRVCKKFKKRITRWSA